MIRAGAHGEYEQKFLQDSRVYVTWPGLSRDLSKIKSRDDLFVLLDEMYPRTNPKKLHNWVAQLWPFTNEMAKGELVVLPLKMQRTIAVGELTGDYVFEPKGPDPYFHWRTVKWLSDSIPRAHFGQDLLYSLGSSLTICRVKRNNAEARIKAMRASGWKPETIGPIVGPGGGSDPDDEAELAATNNLEDLARDQIARLISARFKGHGLTVLVDAILKAQGYTTYRSPEGADGGADILAGAGPLGFGQPRLCVEVKSEATPIDRPSVDKLLGAMTKFGAQEGLFVSWSGYKGTVQKELATTFFRMRLWTQSELLEALFANYDRLDEDIKAELPLKRIWTVAAPEEE